MNAWLMAFRPKTLTAALVPVLVATALVAAHGHRVIWWITICAILSALCIQIGTNLVNDAFDFKKGADDHRRIGPKRVTQSGLFSARTVLIVAALMFALATALGVPLVLHGGLPIVVIGLVSILCGYAYTAGPFPLAYKGMGDVFVIFFFGVVAVTGTVFLHTGIWSGSAWIAGLQIGMLATVLIAINNLRDIETDREVGKRTLAVRLDVQGARAEIFILLALPYLLNGFWYTQGYLHAALLPLLTLPLAWRLSHEINRHQPGQVYNRFLAWAAALHLSFGALLTLGFFWR